MVEDITEIISARRIKSRVRQIAELLDKFYPADEEIVLVGVLSGAAWLTCDLSRAMQRSVSIDWVKVRTYQGTESMSPPFLIISPGIGFAAGKHIVVVEDVIDSGRTA